MKKIITSLILSSLLFFSFSDSLPAKNKVEAITFAELEKKLNEAEEELVICNFWATWCKPCVAELPYFEALHTKYQGKRIKVLLVSLDRPSMLDSRVQKFVNNENLTSEVVLLDEQNLTQDDWIPMINKDWEGDIPATLFVHKATAIQDFYAGSFESLEELEEKILPFLNKQ